MYHYLCFGHQESIAAIGLTLNTQNDCFKADFAIFKKKINDISSDFNFKKVYEELSILVL